MPPRPQARIPSTYALFKLLLRVVTLLLSIIVLIFLIYISVRYKKNFPVAYAAIIYAFFLDTAEIIIISDRYRSVPQLSPLPLLILELGALGLLAGGCVTMVLADFDEQFHGTAGYTYPADPWRMDAFWMQVAVGICHILYAVLSCVDGCRGV